MSAWVDVGPLDAIALRGARVIKTVHGCVALFRTAEDAVFALDNSCPHKGGPLAEGIVHGRSVTCPLHNWVFSLETGEAQGTDAGAVTTYPVRVENGRILVDRARLMGQRAA